MNAGKSRVRIAAGTKAAKRNGRIRAASFGRMTCGAEACKGMIAVISGAAASGIQMRKGFHSQVRRSGENVFADRKAEGGADFLPADASERGTDGEDRSGGGGDRGRGKSRRPNEMQDIQRTVQTARKAIPAAEYRNTDQKRRSIRKTQIVDPTCCSRLQTRR